MVTHVDMPEAQAQLPTLLAKVEFGEEVIITREGNPVARLVGYDAPLQQNNPPKGVRRPGVLKGKVFIDYDLFEKPLPDDLLKAWGELPE